jgi:hypothetical protein
MGRLQPSGPTMTYTQALILIADYITTTVKR